ncbi:ABC transporter substrate-binding protein [Chromobacterium sp. LK11]|uniref:cobalamin-binding protein n=1 Tax=Chromobacterium sp. LK11 TaxID=1628212 RepID=UPI000652B502|nr:cobalamin-binding protein [Chromobacterium sp. LK11]KMN82518.1 ABC transporter substrate-binding protein [Chromobacterium sp. LK11]
MKRLLGLTLLLSALPAPAAVSVQDGSGRTITLAQPAQRILTLVPHATEMLYAIGAGDKLVATVEHSDHPDAAKRLPRVGSFTGFSLEEVMRQRPDLVVAWRDGGAPRELERLRGLGIPVYLSHPLQPDDVAKEMLALGRLTGADAGAGKAAASYRQRLADLRRRYGARVPVRVFYQVSQTPIFTISDQSFMGPLIRLCGGVNVFGELKQPAAQVSAATVVTARPQAILAGDEASLRMWRRWQALPAVAKDALFALPGDAMVVPGPRLADGAAALCLALDTARQRLGLTAK